MLTLPKHLYLIKNLFLTLFGNLLSYICSRHSRVRAHPPTEIQPLSSKLSRLSFNYISFHIPPSYATMDQKRRTLEPSSKVSYPFSHYPSRRFHSVDSAPCERCVKIGAFCEYRPVDPSSVSINHASTRTNYPYQEVVFDFSEWKLPFI